MMIAIFLVLFIGSALAAGILYLLRELYAKHAADLERRSRMVETSHRREFYERQCRTFMMFARIANTAGLVAIGISLLSFIVVGIVQWNT